MPSRSTFKKALLEVMEELDSVADDAISLANALDETMDESRLFSLIQDGRRHLDAAESLLAQVANRGGLSWDRIAARYEVSKQSLHRRLSARGGRAYEETQARHGPTSFGYSIPK